MKNLLSKIQAARYCRVSKSKIDAWVKNGLPYYQELGSPRMKFKAEDLETYFEFHFKRVIPTKAVKSKPLILLGKMELVK